MSDSKAFPLWGGSRKRRVLKLSLSVGAHTAPEELPSQKTNVAAMTPDFTRSLLLTDALGEFQSRLFSDYIRFFSTIS